MWTDWEVAVTWVSRFDPSWTRSTTTRRLFAQDDGRPSVRNRRGDWQARRRSQRAHLLTQHGRPFIILREQGKKTRTHGIEAIKVCLPADSFVQR